MMQDVSQRFLDAIGQPQKRVSRVTFTPVGGEAEELVIVGGTVSLDASAFFRRRARLSVVGGTDLYRRLAVPGGRFVIEHGFDFGGSLELVPVFTGTAEVPQQRHGGGQIDLSLIDYAVRVERARFLSPYSPAKTTNRVTAVTSLIQGAVPGTQVTSTATGAGTVGADAVWREGRQDAIRDLLRDADAEGFFTPDGNYRIRNMATIDDPVAWTVRGIVLGSPAKSVGGELPYNTVVVRPATADGTQNWPQQVAVVDADSPRHPDKIGAVPYFYASPTISSAGQALSVANSMLRRLQGSTETLDSDIISNPALEGGDAVQVIIPGENGAAAETYIHLVDRFSIDLNSGQMSLSTRSRGVVDA